MNRVWVCFLQGGAERARRQGLITLILLCQGTELEFVWFYKFGIVCIFILSIKVNSCFFLKYFLEPLNV